MSIAYERCGVEHIIDDLCQRPGEDHTCIEQAALDLSVGQVSVSVSKHGRVFKDRGTHGGEARGNALDGEEPA